MEDARRMSYALKTALLSIILFICSIGATRLVGLADSTRAENAAGWELLMCVLHCLVISHLVLRSKWSGIRLAFAVFFIYFGVVTFQPQIEALVYLNYLTNHIPAEWIPRMWAEGLIVAAIFSPIAVLLLGKWGPAGEEIENAASGAIILREKWLGWMIVTGLVYLVIYFAFGGLVFLPLAGPEFEKYYGDIQLPAWSLPFQVVRGVIWAGLALLVVRMMRGNRWEAALTVALLFAVLMGTLLLVPTEFMSERIRWSHLVEVISSNFLFGWISVYLLTRKSMSTPSETST